MKMDDITVTSQTVATILEEVFFCWTKLDTVFSFGPIYAFGAAHPVWQNLSWAVGV